MTRMLRWIALPLAAGMAVGALELVPAAGSESDPLQVRPSPCSGLITATVGSDPIATCGETEVTVSLVPECPTCPGGINIVFIQLDEAPQSGWQNQESIRILDEVRRYAEDHEPEHLNMAVVHYDAAGARTAQPLTSDFGRMRGALNSPSNGYIARGAAEDAANEGVKLLRQARRKVDNVNVRERCEIIVMFAHVKSHDPHAEELRNAGMTLRREGALFLVGCPIDPGAWYCAGPEPEMPRTLREYAKYSESGKLPGVAAGEVRNWRSQSSIREVFLEQILPAGLGYVSDSASVAPLEVITSDTTTTVRWHWEGTDVEDPRDLTYRVSAVQTGDWQIDGSMQIIDNVRLARTMPVPVQPVVHVESEACADLPTSTPVPPSATPTATATDLPTATPTPRPNTIYLPIGVREECYLSRRHADVVLVIDLSTSMGRATRAGRPKLDAVLEAAQSFVDTMNLEPDENGDFDQVAIVGFNHEAWIEQSLTSNRSDLHAALGAIPSRVHEFTRLDLALQVGAEALRDPARRPESTPMLILLTDGLPNQVPYAEDGTMETTVLRAAAVAKTAGARLYTIGVGHTDSADPIDQINPELLRAVASDPSMFYHAPDAEEVKAIYAEVAVTFGCPPGRHNWSRPWP